jgi:hypothetical protein
MWTLDFWTRFLTVIVTFGAVFGATLGLSLQGIAASDWMPPMALLIPVPLALGLAYLPTRFMYRRLFPEPQVTRRGYASGSRGPRSRRASS